MPRRRWIKRLLGMTLTDNRGFEADQLDLELDDADGLVIMPRRGAVISLALGWRKASRCTQR